MNASGGCGVEDESARRNARRGSGVASTVSLGSGAANSWRHFSPAAAARGVGEGCEKAGMRKKKRWYPAPLFIAGAV